MNILKHIVWENSNMALNFFSRPRGSWVIDQNDVLHVSTNNSITVWDTEILMPFLRFSDNLLQDNSSYFVPTEHGLGCPIPVTQFNLLFFMFLLINLIQTDYTYWYPGEPSGDGAGQDDCIFIIGY